MLWIQLKHNILIPMASEENTHELEMDMHKTVGHIIQHDSTLNLEKSNLNSNNFAKPNMTNIWKWGSKTLSDLKE